jgi:DNA-binding response OmpR family regulator
MLTENGTLQPGVSIIEKPFTRRDLVDRIRTHLRRAATAPAGTGSGTP